MSRLDTSTRYRDRISSAVLGSVSVCRRSGFPCFLGAALARARTWRRRRGLSSASSSLALYRSTLAPSSMPWDAARCRWPSRVWHAGRVMRVFAAQTLAGVVAGRLGAKPSMCARCSKRARSSCVGRACRGVASVVARTGARAALRACCPCGAMFACANAARARGRSQRGRAAAGWRPTCPSCFSELDLQESRWDMGSAYSGVLQRPTKHTNCVTERTSSKVGTVGHEVL